MWITFSICGKERLFVDKKSIFMSFSFVLLSFSFAKTQNKTSYPPKSENRTNENFKKVDKLSTENEGFSVD